MVDLLSSMSFGVSGSETLQKVRACRTYFIYELGTEQKKVGMAPRYLGTDRGSGVLQRLHVVAGALARGTSFPESGGHYEGSGHCGVLSLSHT